MPTHPISGLMRGDGDEAWLFLIRRFISLGHYGRAPGGYDSSFCIPSLSFLLYMLLQLDQEAEEGVEEFGEIRSTCVNFTMSRVLAITYGETGPVPFTTDIIQLYHDSTHYLPPPSVPQSCPKKISLSTGSRSSR